MASAHIATVRRPRERTLSPHPVSYTHLADSGIAAGNVRASYVHLYWGNTGEANYAGRPAPSDFTACRPEHRAARPGEAKATCENIGQVILLNGPSSAGKTTLAKALRDRLYACLLYTSKSGAELHLPQLPATAFVSIGDFIAESLAAACRYGMREIAVACMPGKLCKYAAGFENTHAHKVSQDMDLLRAEVRRTLPAETGLHGALKYSASVREALLSIPPDARDGLLRRLAWTALRQFSRRCTGNPALRLLVFDFEGGFLFEDCLLYTSRTVPIPSVPAAVRHSSQ